MPAGGLEPHMSTLLCFGLGYCARHHIAEYGGRFHRIIGTTRARDNAEEMARKYRVEMLVFDGAATSGIEAAIAGADMLLVSAPPLDGGDPVLAIFSDPIARAPRLRSIVYLSTVGVYGDRAGAWVDETSTPTPTSSRGLARIAAETAWQEIGNRTRASLAILRLAGIYGPQRNALAQLRAGTAKRIIKPGQVFGRIHVADIAAVIDKAYAVSANGVFNVADDEPAPPQDVIAFAADLLGRAMPHDLAFADAAKTMSPMALSFYAECRRVRNDRIKRELGISLRYPTYREGLRALLANESVAE
jgi:nucleoside-diphosphate-sugar epimerase